MDRFVLTGDWATDAWDFYAAVNYIGSFEDAPDLNQDTVLDFDEFTTRKVDAFVTLGLQASYIGIEASRCRSVWRTRLTRRCRSRLATTRGCLWLRAERAHSARPLRLR